jgi:hypothetical protein
MIESIENLERFVSDDLPQPMSIADFRKRVVSYGKNSLTPPIRELSEAESKAMFEIGERLSF